MNPLYRLSLALIILTGIICLAPLWGRPSGSPRILGDQDSLNQSTLISLTNNLRLQHHLSPLTPDHRLSQAATSKAQHMIDYKYFDHNQGLDNPSWDFITRAGYDYGSAAENLARNYYSAPDIIQAWFNSPSHRDNLLNPGYTHIGVGIAYAANKSPVIVALYAAPLADQALPATISTPVITGGQTIGRLFTFFLILLIALLSLTFIRQHRGRITTAPLDPKLWHTP